MNSPDTMGSTKSKNVQEVESICDNLQNEDSIIEDNYFNLEKEVNCMKYQLDQQIDAAWTVIRRLDKQVTYLRKIIDNLEKLLRTHKKHLSIAIVNAEEDCEQDCKSFMSGHVEDVENFLDAFLEHRKEYYWNKIVRDRLAKELKILSIFQ